MSNSFFQNISVTGITTLLTIVVALVNNIIVTRWIGPEDRGIYAVVINIVFLMNLIFGEGLRRTNTLIAAMGKDKLFSLLILNLIFLVLLSLISIGFSFLFPSFSFLLPNIGYELLFIGVLISIFSIMWQAIQAIFLGYQQIKTFNVLALMSIVLILIFNIIGIFGFEISLNYVLLNTLWSYLFTLLTGSIILILQIKAKKTIEFHFLKTHFKVFVKATVSSLDIFIIKKANVLFVNNLIGATNAGYYSIANTLSDLVQKFPNVIGTLVFSDSANNDSLEYIDKLNRILRVLLLLDVIIVLFLWLFGELLILILFGELFKSAMIPLKWMLFSFILLGPASIIHAFFMGKGFPKILITINTLSALVAIFVYYYLILNFDIVGAGIAYSLIAIMWSLSYYFYYVKETKSNLNDIILIKKEDIVLFQSKVITILRKK